MKRTPWSLVEPGTRIEQIAPCCLVVFTDHERQLVRLRLGDDSSYQWERVDRGSLMVVPPTNIDGGQPLEVLGRRLAWKQPGRPRFLLVPGFTASKWPMGLWLLLTTASAVLTMLVTLATNNQLLFGLGFMVTLLVPVWIATVLSRVEVLGQQRMGVTWHTVHAYALAVERGELWQGELPAGAMPSPAAQVERIRQDYARLRSDLVYRLECPALFDPAVPTTAAFEAALVDFEDSLTAQAAARVEVRFEAARQHAERTGLRHVDARDRAEVARAVKVARLAQDAPSPGERAAALAQLQRILEPLALYYLPSRTELPAIEG
ncbi:MAG: hypothetical protein Q4D96_01940 [Propionibacteriaceae bacterium]|nr:hypothetical protein [Propionibacteriaceae bacterium]